MKTLTQEILNMLHFCKGYYVFLLLLINFAEYFVFLFLFRSVHKRYLTFPGQSLNLGCYMRLLLYNPIHYSTWPIINPQRDVKKKIPCLTKKALMGPVILMMETENTSSGQVWLRQQADKSK